MLQILVSKCCFCCSASRQGVIKTTLWAEHICHLLLPDSVEREEMTEFHKQLNMRDGTCMAADAQWCLLWGATVAWKMLWSSNSVPGESVSGFDLAARTTQPLARSSQPPVGWGGEWEKSKTRGLR